MESLRSPQAAARPLTDTGRGFEPYTSLVPVAVGLVAGMFALWRSVALGVNMADEAWFLQVVARMLDGDTLYSDVRVGILPLAFYLTAVPAAAFGVQVIVVKAMVALAFGASTAITLHLARRFEVSWRGQVLLVAAMVGFGMPAVANAYNPLSISAILAAAATAAWWVDCAMGRRPLTVPSLILGGVTGVVFAIKFTLGAWVAVAVAAIIWWAAARRSTTPRTAIAASLLSAGGFFGVMAVVALPVAVSGGLGEMLRQLFDKGSFVELASVPIGEGLAAWWRAVGDGDLTAALRRAPFVLVVAAVPVMAAGVWRADRDERSRLGAVALVLVAGLLMVYPRSDLAHVSYAAPVAITATVIFGSRLTTTQMWRRAFLGAGIVGSVLAVVLVVIPPIQRGLERPSVDAGPFRGARVEPAVWADVVETARVLGGGDGDRIFVLSSRASTLYLLAELENPTPYDYPLLSQFGAEGMADVMAAIDAGAIDIVCAADRWPERLAPTPLLEFVDVTMQPGVELPECRLHS